MYPSPLPLVLSALLLAGLAKAHGGFFPQPPPPSPVPSYGGPQDAGPRGGGRGTTPSAPASGGQQGPSTPGTPSPAAPRQGGPTLGGGPAPGPRTPSAAGLDADYTRWVYWWEYNKEHYLRLREPFRQDIATGSDEMFLGDSRHKAPRPDARATRDDVRLRIAPALAALLAESESRDIQTSALVALAKAARRHDDGSLERHARRLLRSGEQEVRENAVLALGVARSKAAIPLLESLLRDDRSGRELAGKAEVDERMRAFAAYSLGLVAEKGDTGVKLGVLDTLLFVLEDAATTSREIKVALVTAVRISGVPPADARQKRALWRCLDGLERYERADLGRTEQWVQSHVPTTVAALLGRERGDDHARYLEGFARELQSGKKRVEAMQQSAALALGSFATPGDTASVAALLEASRSAADAQTRFFALLALGQIGGRRARDELVLVAAHGRVLERPWAALGLGVLAWEGRNAGAPEDDELGATLQRMLDENKNPEVLGAAAIALGLARRSPAADRLLALLEESRQQDGLAGHVCVALGMLGENRALERLRSMLKTSARRPELLRAAAIALGKLGDGEACAILVAMLEQPDADSSRLAAAAQALLQIGDRRSIDPLLHILQSGKATSMARAYAAAALGGLADEELLPWNASLGRNLNYRSAVPTLIDHAGGVLDIL
jgi:HEAT repeat protein